MYAHLPRIKTSKLPGTLCLDTEAWASGSWQAQGAGRLLKTLPVSLRALTQGGGAAERVTGTSSSTRGMKSPLSLFSGLSVFQRSSRAAAEIPAFPPMAGGKALAFATVTHSSLSASLPLSWWGRRQSRAKRITSGRLRSQAACVSEQEGASLGSLPRDGARSQLFQGPHPQQPCRWLTASLRLVSSASDNAAAGSSSLAVL